MPEFNIDFEGSAVQEPAGNADVNPANQDDKDHLNGPDVDDVTGQDGNNTTEPDNTDNNTVEGGNEGTDDNSSTGGLESGTEVEYDGVVYVVNDNGDLVDENGNIFKQASEVDAWLKENDANNEDSDEPLSLNAIRDAIGIDITDDQGNVIEFTDDAEGVKQYVDSVISLKSSEIQQGAVNKLFADYPLLKEFVDYVQLTGSPQGFGDIPDRSGIQLDKNNEMQLEAVIRMAAKEFGNASLNDTYIKYLKDSGALYDEAKNQLQALVGKDQAYKQQIAAQAEAARQQEQEELNQYWQGVASAIEKRVIGGYKLPETFVKEINGQQITFTPDDFYRYVAEAREIDEEGTRMTGYQRDLNRLSNEDALNKELLDAWLMFTGGSYKDLVDMAIKEDKVRRLVIKSKQQRAARTIKVNKPKQGKVNPDDIILS